MNKTTQAGSADHASGVVSRVGAQDSLIVVRVPGSTLGSGELRELLEGCSEADAVHGPAFADPSALMRDAYVCHGADAPETYIYLPAMSGAANARAQAQRLELSGARRWPGTVAVVYDVLQAIEGASAGKLAYWHYIVETDVLPDAEQDFNDWYATEHLPGLAGVPGTVRAVRLRALTGSPRYHALYMLETRETFGSEPWLAVRATPWSDRVRPNFRNTKRTMFTIQTS